MGTWPDQLALFAEGARQWHAADKIVYSRTLTEPRSARTRVVHECDAAAVQQLKAESARNITINGPDLAAKALRTGLVDALQRIVFPVVLGGGKPFLRQGVRMDLDLLDERRFGNGAVVPRYSVRRAE